MTLEEVRKLMAFEDEMDCYLNSLVDEANKDSRANLPQFTIVGTPKPHPNPYKEIFNNDNPR